MARGTGGRRRMAFTTASRGAGLLIGEDGGGCDCGATAAVDEETLRRLVEEAFDRAVDRHFGDGDDADADEPTSAENDRAVRSMGVLTRTRESDPRPTDPSADPAVRSMGVLTRSDDDPADRSAADPEVDAYTSAMGYFSRDDR